MKKRITKKILKKNVLFRKWTESWLQWRDQFFTFSFKDPEIEINTISMGICKKMEEFAFKNVKKYNTSNIKDKYIKRYLVKIV